MILDALIRPEGALLHTLPFRPRGPGWRQGLPVAAELLAASASSLVGDEDSMPGEAAPDMVRAGS